ILNLKYRTTSNLDIFSISRSVRINAGQVKKYKESKEKTIQYINNTFESPLSNNKKTEKKLKRKKLKTIHTLK
ncbi:hypothetical protein, partial [Klebsiella michiganensis]